MSEEVKIVLPKLGESILSASVVRWFKKIGDPIQLDEPLLEVSTDKVNSEIPSPVSGVLSQIHAEPDQELQVGDLIAVVVLSSSSAPRPVSQEVPLATTAAPVLEGKGENSDLFSPAILRLAKENGISFSDLEKMQGTGTGGRITKKDIEEYILKKKSPSSCAPCSFKKEEMVSSGLEVEKVKMSGMRKAIAENMVRSFYEAPHATLVTEVDVSKILKYIREEKDAFLNRHGFKLTITSFIAKALADSLQEFPLINSSLEKDTILLKRFINLGIAVSIDQGLVVPVIKHLHKMQLTDIAKSIHELSTKARMGKLTQEDLTEGTMTLTNFGMSGVQIGVPIIRYPEVAIIGIGAITKKVIPLEDDVLAVRSMVHISLTFDHRVLDGMYGCGFLGSLKKHLESFSLA